MTEMWRLGTIVSSVTGGATVKFDGESAASTRVWPKNPSVSFSAGNRVLCANVNGTWFILSKLPS